MTHGFGGKGVSMEATVQLNDAVDSSGSEGVESSLNSLLHTLRTRAAAALAEEARVKHEVDSARRVLVRTAEAAAGALERLAHAEEQLEYKWAKLATLLCEVKELERERHEAMLLAQQLGSIEAEGGPLDVIEDADAASSLESELDDAPLAAVSGAERNVLPSPVADLRTALKQVSHSSLGTRFR